MKVFETKEIRNVGIIGGPGVGKTSVAEALLFNAGATNRMGKVNAGSSLFDFEPEEIQGKLSINSTIASFIWKKQKINLIDTPGFLDFLTDTKDCIRAIDGAIIVLSSLSEWKVEVEKVWKYAEESKIPLIAFVNKMDRERADFLKAIENLEKEVRHKLTPVQLPIGTADSFRGIIDLTTLKALIYESNELGKYQQAEVPSEMTAEVKSLRDKMAEAIAETDDELLEKYLEAEELKGKDLEPYLRQAVLSRKLIPVYCGSAEKNIGMVPLLEAIINLQPSPLDRGVVLGTKPTTNEVKERKPDPREPLSALVFKTIVDPYAGKLSLIRVYSGEFNSDSNIFNSSQQEKEKIGQIFQMMGKQQQAMNPAVAGDIVAVAKLRTTSTGDTLSDEVDPIILDPLDFQPATISFALKPKGKGDEEKITTSLAKLQEEDPTLKLQREQQTKEIILSGVGQRHLEVTAERLKRKFGVEVELRTPKVPYQETIRSRAQAQGKYKKQSGGRGQYGDTWTEIEPLPRGQGFEFVNKITGGVIPRQYIPAVEKGIREAMSEGILAGYPVVDLRATLYDGSFHEVDSSDMAFKIAGALGFKKGFSQANPVLLEPIMSMEICVPDEFMGDVIGDLNSRRGKVIGMEPRDGNQVIKAQAPMSEVLRYEPDLRSMTQGRGTFNMQLSYYEELPPHLGEKIIAASKSKEDQGKNQS